MEQTHQIFLRGLKGLSSVLLGVVAAVAASVIALIAVAWWPDVPGVVLTSADRYDLGRMMVVVGAPMALIAQLVGGPRALPIAATSPLILLVASFWAPGGDSVVWPAYSPAVWLAPVVGVWVAAGLCRTGLGRGYVFSGAIALATIGAALSMGVRPAADPPAPKMVVLTLDTLRADHLDFMGGDVEFAHTPHLSALAAESLVFRQAYSPQPLTGPAHASLFSGLSTTEHGLRINAQPLPEDIPWVPEMLAAAGWRPRAFVSTAMLDAGLGFVRGFERYDSTFSGRDTRAFPLLWWEGRETGEWMTDNYGGAAVWKASEHMSDFTWVHLYDAHWPYTPSREAAERVGVDPTPLDDDPRSPLPRETDPAVIERGAKLYRAEIEDLDAHVGDLLAAIPDDAILIVAADHGESLGEHDYAFGHGTLAFAPDARIPLLIRAPGVAPGVVDHPVALQDIAPTILELAGLPIPPEMSARSLLDPDPTRAVSTVAFAKAVPLPFMMGPGLGLSSSLGHYSGVAVRTAAGAAAASRWTPPARYDPAGDPRDLTPIPFAEGDPLDAALRALATSAVPDAVPPEEGMEEALRALGYVE